MPKLSEESATAWGKLAIANRPVKGSTSHNVVVLVDSLTLTYVSKDGIEKVIVVPKGTELIFYLPPKRGARKYAITSEVNFKIDGRTFTVGIDIKGERKIIPAP